jgi:hypothetical protein
MVRCSKHREAAFPAIFYAAFHQHLDAPLLILFTHAGARILRFIDSLLQSILPRLALEREVVPRSQTGLLNPMPALETRNTF